MRYVIDRFSVTFDPPAHTYLVEVENKVQFTHVAKERIQNLYKEMYSLQISQLIIICVDARAEEQSRIAAIYDFRGTAEFDEIRLMLLVARCNKAVDFAFEFDLLVVGVGIVPLRKPGFAPANSLVSA